MTYQTLVNCFAQAKKPGLNPIIEIVFEKQLDTWLKQQSASLQNWANTNKLKQQKLLVIANQQGGIEKVIAVLKDPTDWLAIGALPLQLPEGTYQLTSPAELSLAKVKLAWGLGAYQFIRYKKAARMPAKLLCQLKTAQQQAEILHLLEAIYLVRDLVNTPADDMTPAILAQQAAALAQKFKAKFSEIIGKNLLKQNFPCVYHVGRASVIEPRLIELRWGNKKHPKVTLVGKGVCFDSGGLDLKDANGMLAMKKDMGGAAHVLGLGYLIMAQQLPIQLRILIPAVENAVSGNAYRPGDILTSRAGKTVEIMNTDAEGRLILADALTAAVEEQPDLLIDFATLTGAAKVALGTEVAGFFTDDENLATSLTIKSQDLHDPCWRLPLYKPYRKLLESSIADIANCALGGYAGAITAALYLQEFVPNNQRWVHFDIMAANVKAGPGRPVGGEANALRAVYEILKDLVA